MKIIITILSVLIATPLMVGAAYLWEYGSFEERADVAEEIGLVTDADFYRGTYEQNIPLLNYYQNNDMFGVAIIPDVVAWLEDTLQTAITASSTSLTLVTGTDKEGNALSGTFGLTINEGSADEELVIATCAGTACTDLIRGISVIDGETSVYASIKAHRRGVSIKITDAPFLMVAQRLLNGDEGFPNTLFYNYGNQSIATSGDFVSKKYCDDVGAGGFTALNVATSYGLYALGTAPETVGIDLSSLSGLRMDNEGDLQIATSSGSGIYVDTDNTFKVATTSDYSWTGTHSFSGNNTHSGTETFSATSTFSNLIADGFVKAYTALEGISAMDAVISTSTATTTSQMVAVADASIASTTFSFIGFALTSAEGGETVYVQTSGEVSGFTGGLTTTTVYFISDTAGEISDSSGTVEGIVGIATDYDTINLDTRANYGMQYVGSASLSVSGNQVLRTGVCSLPTNARIILLDINYTYGGHDSSVTILKKGKTSATASQWRGTYRTSAVCTYADSVLTCTSAEIYGENDASLSGTCYFYR